MKLTYKSPAKDVVLQQDVLLLAKCDFQLAAMGMKCNTMEQLPQSLT